MAVSKLKLLKISSSKTNLENVLERFVSLHCLHPVSASEFVDSVHGLTSIHSNNPCSLIHKELIDLEKENDFVIPEVVVYTMDYSLENMKEYVSNTHEKLKQLTNHKNDLSELIKKYENALFQVNNIEELDISLDDLFSCEWINARVGRMPLDSVQKLVYYENKPFIFQVFHEEKNYVWCMYLSTNKFEREIDNIFSSLFFDRIRIPDFVHGTPESAQNTLKMEIKVAKESLDEVENEIKEILDENLNKLSVVKGEVIYLNKINDAKRYVVGLGDNFNINGFVETKSVDTVIDKFSDLEDVEIEVLPPDSDKRLKPPTRLKNGWFSKPFGMFVEMYGLPGYFDIDPTPIVAITYSLLFGVMFGDLGQGLLLALLGWLFYRKTKKPLAAIAVRIGLVSAFFGLLYGSFFGNEEILTPIFTKVLGFQDKLVHVMDPGFTMTLLISTVGLGSILIIGSMILNMIVAYKKRDYSELLCSHNGLAGLMFYSFILAVVVDMAIGNGNFANGLTIIVFVVIPLLLIVMKHPFHRRLHGEKMFPDSIGGFIIESFFELFEVILSYITNTMSFLRVGGFVLSHAGMMMVVNTLVAMSGSVVGQGAILVFGNLFVMGLEGLIVGIQVLRLEFYEMFSRYFEGNGYPFETFD